MIDLTIINCFYIYVFISNISILYFLLVVRYTNLKKEYMWNYDLKIL